MPIPLNPASFYNPLSALQRETAAGAKPSKKELLKACRDFESLFVNYLMQQMRATVPENALFGDDQAEKIYTGMLDNEISKTISQQRGIGLASLLYAQMSAAGQDDGTKK
jgi:peptidoglycan hydrolase FlgJ